jgi:signal peptidase I
MRSMEPSFYQGDHIMVNKVTYRSSDPQRGDVIVFDPPFESPYPFIKRLIGLPGDTVEIKDGKVFINGIALEEAYIVTPPDYTMLAREVPGDEYFVLGDNRNDSNDSHAGWTVPRDNIIGRAWFTYWPPSRWSIIEHYRYPELNQAGEQGTVISQSIEVLLE